MGKRKRERDEEKTRRKIRHQEKRLRNSSTSSDSEEYDRYYPTSPMAQRISSDSDRSDENNIRSYVVDPLYNISEQNSTTCTNIPSTSAQEPVSNQMDTSNITEPEILPQDILDALGDAATKDEVLGPPISEEIAKRWGKVIIDGMTKEAKEAAVKKILIPENFLVLKVSQLNIEISAVLSGSIKYRDKLLQRNQNQLGLGIAGFSNLASSLIKEDIVKVEILQKLSEINQLFLNLHYESTKHRRKLITSSLDKKFSMMISDVKRDDFLFGVNLGEKIKATKTAERSGLQIKRPVIATPTTSRQQGNWRGPPRSQQNKATRPGGHRTSFPMNKGYTTQQTRKPVQMTSNRPPAAVRPDFRTRKNQ
ncbi:hypothetical protein evm_002353 [Chilo suppressalis]|nr:hypothetical protein evm_002353 [Chilo suppressalis]